MNTIKTFKRGEYLYKEGEKAQFLFLIQSGSVKLQLARPKQTIEICTLGGAQIIGEHALSGISNNPHSAVAAAEIKAIELPIEALKVQIESGSQIQKLLTKSLCDKLKIIMKDYQSIRLERDNTPCPMDQTAKIFGVVFHVAKCKGEALNDKPKQKGQSHFHGQNQGSNQGQKSDDASKEFKVSVNWQSMRQYAQRIFLESPIRLQMAINIFVKLGWAKYEMGKIDDKEDSPEEIIYVHFYDLQAIEQFFEYYQHYYFKGGKAELLKTDEKAMQIVRSLLSLSVAETPDRRGFVRIEYAKVIEDFKNATGLQLNNDHWALLEGKGLMVKRQSGEGDKGVTLEFEFKEFERYEKIWKVLREVERWNEKGSVDPNEPIVEAKKLKNHNQKNGQKNGPSCPECGHGFESLPKFCSECGHKLATAA